jgi:putative peptidoglycan lipid II flippase
VILWGVYLLLGPLLGTAGWRYGALAVLVASGIFSYALIGQALGAFYLRELRETIRRG